MANILDVETVAKRLKRLPEWEQVESRIERVFEFEVSLPEEAPTEFLGNRVHVRFDHGYEPIGLQMYRSVRQLLLRQFGV